MRKAEKIMVLDVETCNTLEQPLPYDIGYVITDRKGNIYKKESFVVAEIFCDMSDVMQSAYYKEKIPNYWEDIKNGDRKLRTMWTIYKVMKNDIKEYKIKTVGAYNAYFDKTAMNNLIRFVTKSKFRWWFPYKTDFICIWHMACQTILNTKSYIKFAERNNLMTESQKNLSTSAESTYKFLTQNLDFEESHTGLEDVEIEVQIMKKCFETHKKMDKAINRMCWRLPQMARKKWAV